MFKILYNSDFDLFNTKDAVLRASDGQWYISKSLKLSTTDKNFLHIANLKLFGETTKSLAVVETSVQAGNKTEVFISNIERLFQSGEYVRVVDSNNQDVYFKDGKIVKSTTYGAEILRAKIVGQISTITIDPKNRGKYYEPGDPVVVYGGLSSNTDIGASAIVGQTKTGSIQRINVINGGYGYNYFPNTFISFTTETNGANAIVGSLNPDPASISNVAMIPIDTVSFKKDIIIGDTQYQFANFASANANTRLVDAFSFTSLITYPISSVLVKNGGSGIKQQPQMSVLGGYSSDLIIYGANTANTPLLSSLGILAPIQITNGGTGYQNNETIIFSGGSGQGAYANVTVNATGTIVSVNYVEDILRRYPLGGMGYRSTDLPSVTVQTSGGSDASLYVPGILGEGAVLTAVTDNTGEIVSVKIIDSGEDYTSTPNVSLKVQDILVSNVSIINQPKKGDTIIQGADINVATYIATVNSVTVLSTNIDPEQSIWNLRVFNYTSLPDPTKTIDVLGKDGKLTKAGEATLDLYKMNAETEKLGGSAAIDTQTDLTRSIYKSDLDTSTSRNPVDVAKEWIAGDVSLVVITRGANGLVGVTKSGVYTVPGVKIDVVDTIGAGDTVGAVIAEAVNKF